MMNAQRFVPERHSRAANMPVAAALVFALMSCSTPAPQAQLGSYMDTLQFGDGVPFAEWRLADGTALVHTISLADTVTILLADPSACADCNAEVSRLMTRKIKNPSSNLLLFTRAPTVSEAVMIRRLGIRHDGLLVSGPKMLARGVRVFTLAGGLLTEVVAKSPGQ